MPHGTIPARAGIVPRGRWSPGRRRSAPRGAVQADADAEGRIDWSMVSVDSTTCRAHQHAASASTRAPKILGRLRSPARHRPDEALGRSRGGLTSKIHLAGEGGCRPLGFVIMPGQWGDAAQMIPVLEEIRVPRQAGGRSRTRPEHVGGDKAYSYAVIGVTCADARSSIRSQSRETSGPTAGAAAAKEASPRASTRRSTAAATRSSGPSTGSRTSAPSPRASTNGRTSSTGRSPWPPSPCGSVRSEMPR